MKWSYRCVNKKKTTEKLERRDDFTVRNSFGHGAFFSVFRPPVGNRFIAWEDFRDARGHEKYWHFNSARRHEIARVSNNDGIASAAESEESGVFVYSCTFHIDSKRNQLKRWHHVPRKMSARLSSGNKRPIVQKAILPLALTPTHTHTHWHWNCQEQ